MKILYIAHRIPYPPNKGDKIRSFNEIKHLSMNHEIHLCCLADDPEDLQYQNALKTYCKTVNVVPINPKLAKLKSAMYLFSNKPLSIPYFYSQKLQKAIDRLLATTVFDCIFCFSSQMAEYVFKSKGRQTNGQARLFMDFVDVDSDKWIQYSRYEKWPMSRVHRLEGRRLSGYERKIAGRFDHSIFVSRKEVDIFKSFCPQIKNVAAVPNGVDYKYFSPSFLSPALSGTVNNGLLSTDKECPILLFTGAMDYYANVDGVIWFCREIFPRIQAGFPEVKFYIVGSNPHPQIWSLQESDGIRVTGFVEDIRPYYLAADVCVIPLRLARGVQNKVLEAMAMERPVMATSMAIQGIEAVTDKQLLISDSPEEFASKVMDLLKNEKKRRDLGRNSRKWVKSNYQWSSNMKMLEEILSI